MKTYKFWNKAFKLNDRREASIDVLVDPNNNETTVTISDDDGNETVLIDHEETESLIENLVDALIVEAGTTKKAKK